MRILYLCHRIPYPPNKGEKIRAFHQLQAMAERHEVDLFTLADRSEDAAHAPALSDLCQRVMVARLNPVWARMRALLFLPSKQALTVPYFYSRELSAEIRKAVLTRSYDRIFVYCSAMAQYVKWVKEIPVVMDLVDVDSDKWMQYASVARYPLSAVYRREAARLREYERKLCKRFSNVFVSTEREAHLLRQISPRARVHVIPNGVDTRFFDVSPEPWPAAPAIVFTGDMSYFPNQDAVTFFTLQVLPLVRESVPDVRFTIVGRDPGRAVRRLGRIEGVEVTGFVPDVRPYLAQARVAVAPFKVAAGIQNKILEAMACGLPVVATSRAVQGLTKGVAEMVETGNSAAELAGRVVALLRDPELARRQGMESRSRVAADYNWEKALDRLLQLVENPASAEWLKVEARTHG